MDFGFFPGGNGLYEGNAGDLAAVEVIVLGSNFGCESKFAENGKLIVRDERRTSATWTSKGGLINTFSGARQDGAVKTSRIGIRQCFFTNAWPFLHRGMSNDKPPIDLWLCNEALMEQCISFFQEKTLPSIKPKLIVALGKGPAVFLSRIWPHELPAWTWNGELKWEDLKFSQLDREPFNKIPFPHGDVYCAVIHHRSRAHMNAVHRKPPYSGLEGEVKLLDEVAQLAGVIQK